MKRPWKKEWNKWPPVKLKAWSPKVNDPRQGDLIECIGEDPRQGDLIECIGEQEKRDGFAKLDAAIRQALSDDGAAK
jgi:hypothetical protein